MSLSININDLLNGQTVEWERMEFKTGWNPESIIHSICAFANDINNWGGGYIIVGLEEKDGKPVFPPVGITDKDIDKMQKELLNLCNNLKPAYFPIAEPVVFMKKQILIIWVPGGQTRPYKAPVSLGKDAVFAYYIRRYSSTVKAKLEDERELISLAATVPYDDRIHHNADIADLKFPLIASFLHEIKSDLYGESSQIDFKQLCRKMMIVDGSDEYLKPKNVGLLFFNDRPQRFIPLSQIELVQFESDAGGDILDEKIFQGPIQQQITDVLLYLKNVILKERVVKHPDKAEAERFFNYPYVAIEESIVNAMYHRDYEIREPVEIRINRQSIQILSFPGPDRSIKKQDIDNKRFVSRRYKNRKIGDFLKELKLTEGRCTGIPKIIRAMSNNGSPEPSFETDDERSYFLTTLFIHNSFIDEGDVKGDVEKYEGDVKGDVGKYEGDVGKYEGDVKGNVEKYEGDVEISRLNKTDVAILKSFKDNFESGTTIINRAGYKKMSGFLYRVFHNLINERLIDYMIPDKPKSSKQKYAITSRGKKLLSVIG